MKKRIKRSTKQVGLEFSNGTIVFFVGSLDVLGGLLELVANGLRIKRIEFKKDV